MIERVASLPRPVRLGAAGVAATLALVVVVPALGSYWTLVATLAVVYALMGMSLVVLTGWSGQLNLHVAALGLGLGAYGGFALHSAGLTPLAALVAGGFATLPVSLAVGAVAVRFRGLELAVATLAIGLSFERLAFRNIGKALAKRSAAPTPFESSFVGVARPDAFTGDTAYYLLALAVAAGVLLLLRNLGRRATGRTLRAIREREVAAEVLGVPTYRYRLGAFALSIAVAGTAGSLFAGLQRSIAPDSFNLDVSFPVLAAVVIGGVRSLWGGIAGGVLAAVLPEVVRTGPLRVFSGERLFVVFAAGMVLTLLLRPQGLLVRRRADAGTGAVRDPFELLEGRAAVRHAYANRLERRTRGCALRAQGLEVGFGGVRALDGADVWIAEREICALIGPNGAGKSTLFNCLTGLVRPDAGRVYLSSADVTDMPPHRRTELGMGRTFQSVELFRELTVLENLMVGGHGARTAGPAAEAIGLRASRRSDERLVARARDVAAELGLSGLEDLRPDALSFGHLRLVELGAVLMGDPRALLLDEPSAGLDPSESESFAHLIARLRDERGMAVVLVEHDMAVVGQIAEWVYVLDRGAVIASGAPEDVRRDPLVIARYLGGEVERAAS